MVEGGWSDTRASIHRVFWEAVGHFGVMVFLGWGWGGIGLGGGTRSGGGERGVLARRR